MTEKELVDGIPPGPQGSRSKGSVRNQASAGLVAARFGVPNQPGDFGGVDDRQSHGKMVPILCTGILRVCRTSAGANGDGVSVVEEFGVRRRQLRATTRPSG